MKPGRTMLLPLLALFIVFTSALSALLYMPTTTPFSPWNTGGNGLSELLSKLDAAPVRGLGGVDCASTVILVTLRPLSSEEVEELKRLVDCGSTVIVGDSKGFSAPLLEALGVSAVFEGPVMDEIGKLGYRWVLRTEVGGALNLAAVIPNASAVSVQPQPDMIYAYTSRYAYLDLNGDGFYSVGEPMGSFLVLAGWRMRRGAVVLIPSPLFFTNEYIGLGRNLELLSGVSSGRLYLYTEPLDLPPLDRLKESLYAWSAARPRFLALAASAALSAVTTFVWFSANTVKRAKRGEAALCALLASAPYVSEALANGSHSILILVLPVLLFTALVAPKTALLLSIPAALISAGLKPVYSPLYALIVVIAGRHLEVSEGKSFLGSSSLSLLVLQAANSITLLIYPQLVAAIIAASMAVVGLAAAVYAVYLRDVAVEPLAVGGEVYVGSVIRLGFAVSTPRRVLCIVGRGRSVVEVPGSGGVVATDVAVEHSGINRFTLGLSATDPWGFAYRDFGVFTFEFNALPATVKLLEKASHILGRFGGGARVAEVSLLVLERFEEAGRVVPIPGEKLVEVLRSSGRGAGQWLGEFLKRLIEEYIAGRELKKSRIGEYVGVRMYEPGDPFKAVHWKKSLSKQMLVSKDYAAPGESKGSRAGLSTAGRLIVIANLDSSNPLDLDSVLASLLLFIVDAASRSPSANLDIILISGSYSAVLSGPATGVLRLFYEALRENPPEAVYSYESINRYTAPEEFEYMRKLGGQSLKTVLAALDASVKTVVETLTEAGYRPPLVYTLIHSKATSTWASYVIYTLNSLGYVYRPFAEVMRVA